MILNPVVYGSGGGDKPVLLVTVTVRVAVSVVASKSGTNVSLIYDSTLGKWWAFLPSTGTWTVTATSSNNTQASSTVSVSSVAVFETTLRLSNLPEGFVELEYLRSIGKASDNTGVTMIDTAAKVPSNGIRVVGEVSCEDYRGTGTLGMVIAEQNGDASNGFFIGISGGNFIINAGTLASTWPVIISVSYTLGTKISIEASSIIGNTFLKIDENIIGTSSDTSVRGSGDSIAIFGNHVWQTGNNRFNNQCPSTVYGPLSFFTTTDDTGLISKIYPAKRVSDNALGFYDVVAQNFYVPSANSGYLVGGPEIAAAA